MAAPSFSFEPSNRNWRSFIPLAGVLRHYQKDDWQHDLVAGLVVGVITVPQAIAYAYLAGLPPEAGLYACLAPMVIYAVLGSSRHLVVGPVAVAALMVAATIAQYAPVYAYSPLEIAMVLSLEAGLFLWLLRLTQMGGIVNLLSHPVITGFINAAALLIIISQLSAFSGIEVAHGNPFEMLDGLIGSVASLNGATLALGIASLAVLFAVKQFAVPIARRFTNKVSGQSPWSRTGPLFAVVLATLVTALAGLGASHDVATVGAIDAGLPALTTPPLDLALWRDLVPSAAMIALVAFVESYSVGTSIASRYAARLDTHQELVALGAANLSAAFSGAYPVAGSFSRSGVNVDAGARTPVSSLICAGVILLTLLLLTPLFSHLPLATLAAIVMVSVVGLVDVSSIRRHWRISREDAYTEIITLLTVLLLGVETGLVTGVLLSIALFVRRSSRPHLALVGRERDSGRYRSARRHKGLETHDHIAAIRIDENLYFANSDFVENRLRKIVRRHPDTRHVLLIFTGINLVDVSGIEMLSRFNRNLAQVGVSVNLADVKWQVRRQLDSGRLTESLSGRVFATTDQALRELAD